MFEKFFRLRERNSNVRTELLGGAITFITMAYIIVVNPAILSHARLESDEQLPLGAITVSQESGAKSAGRNMAT